MFNESYINDVAFDAATFVESKVPAISDEEWEAVFEAVLKAIERHGNGSFRGN